MFDVQMTEGVRITMDEKDYIILQHIYQERNITKAAERLYMTQPSLTYRLQQIEKHLGVQLFVRYGKTLEFTPEGEYIVAFAQKMLANIQNLRDHLTNMKSQLHGVLRIAAANITARFYLPQVLKNFTTQYPNIKINIKTGLSLDVLDMLENDSIHVGIIRGDYNWPEGKILISSENICLISKDPIDMAKLPQLNQVYYRPNNIPASHAKYNTEDRFSLFRKIQAWWYERYSVPPLVTMEVGSYEACKEMVVNGFGYAFIPRLFIKPEDKLYTEDLVLKNGEVILRNTWLLYRYSHLQLRHVQKFIEYIKSLPQ